MFVVLALRLALAPALLAGLAALVVRVPHAYLLQAAMPSGINSLVLGHAYGLDLRLVVVGDRVDDDDRCSGLGAHRIAGHMRALVQRVVARRRSASTAQWSRAIGPGLLVLLGITHDDNAEICDRLADKVRALRVFADAEGRMNEPLGEPRGARRQPVHALRRRAQGQPPVVRRRRAARARRAALRALPRAPRRPAAASSARTWRSSSSTTAR